MSYFKLENMKKLLKLAEKLYNVKNFDIAVLLLISVNALIATILLCVNVNYYIYALLLFLIATIFHGFYWIIRYLIDNNNGK